jgi:hypothetical protein
MSFLFAPRMKLNGFVVRDKEDTLKQWIWCKVAPFTHMDKTERGCRAELIRVAAAKEGLELGEPCDGDSVDRWKVFCTSTSDAHSHRRVVWSNFRELRVLLRDERRLARLERDVGTA